VAVGNSSMDVALTVKSLPSQKEVLQAEMTMVAREKDPLTGVRFFVSLRSSNGDRRTKHT
jgi:hypothetical protein